jgi:hypothetical protein
MGLPEEDRRMNFRQRVALKPLAVLLSIVALTVLASGFMESSVRIVGRGAVKAVGVGVFWDVNCTNVATEIDWGLVEPGYHVNATIYLKNEGNAPITLSLDTGNWNPSNASDYITLSWDYANQTLDPQAVLKTKLTLAVSSDVTGITNFTFDIVITGTG